MTSAVSLPWFAHLRGCLSISLMALNTVCWTMPLFAVAFGKAVVPLERWRALTGRVMVALANAWTTCNNLILAVVNQVDWRLSLPEGLNRRLNYLVIANHQSWMDILALQKALLRQVPFLRFFLKKSLIWVPFLGPAWWALDFPFVKRGRRKKDEGDLGFVSRTCRKYRQVPVSIMNFVEGTRFTGPKHHRQGAQYAHLLKPKAGGVAMVLGAMPDCLHGILDVTIAYPDGLKSFWAFLCSRRQPVVVQVEARPIETAPSGDYLADAGSRAAIQEWLNRLWELKDRKLAELTGRGRGGGR
ncbi:MAG: acyltransferase [Pseudomonadota bacterium]